MIIGTYLRDRLSPSPVLHIGFAGWSSSLCPARSLTPRTSSAVRGVAWTRATIIHWTPKCVASAVSTLFELLLFGSVISAAREIRDRNGLRSVEVACQSSRKLEVIFVLFSLSQLHVMEKDRDSYVCVPKYAQMDSYVRSSPSLSSFKTNLKTHLFKERFSLGL